MKRAIILAGCFAVCLTLVAGCISVVGGGSVPHDKQTKADNVNLFVKIDIEKNGAVVDYTSSIVSKDNITLTHAFKIKPANEYEMATMFGFTGKNIRKSSEDSYSMDYSVDLKFPVETASAGGGTVNRSFQYMTDGCLSSITIKLGQPAYIYENNSYKVKLTIDNKK